MRESTQESLKHKSIEILLNTSEYRKALIEAARTIRAKSAEASNEASVVSIFEIEIFTIIREIFGLKFYPEKEVSVDTDFHIAKGRIDSKVGALVIEFKQKSALKHVAQKDKAIEQLSHYLLGLYSHQKQDYYGLVSDGVDCCRVLLKNGELINGSFDKLSADVLDELVRIIILLDKVALTPQNLVRDFSQGDNSISQQLSKTLFNSLKNSATGRSIMLFNEWKELFRLAHDDKSKQKAIQERKGALERVMSESFPKDDNESEYRALYAIQTTYAIIVKIIAYKVISKLQFNKSLIEFSSLSNSSSEVLLRQMQNLEDGAIFRSLGVGNLLEGDFFSWYCNDAQWSDEIAVHIRDIFKILTIYEDKGIFETFEQVQDLFKDLFMSIIPDKVRHSLGEYYTPSWLADHVVSGALSMIDNRENWTSLDPCSGSGTFIIVLIRKILSETTDCTRKQKLDSVLRRVKAIDLNPLAVLTTRINYFVNIAHLIEVGDSFEIPVYLGDSSYVPETTYIDGIECLNYSIQTAKGPILISLPKSICSDSISFSKVMTSLEQDIINQDENSIRNKILALVPQQEITPIIEENISSLADKFIFLERNNWNGIWARIVTNFLTTAALPKVDMIVGNPPWIDWKNLPAGYRDRVKQLCIDRNLFSGDGVTGGINLNICALITFVAASNWLKPDGILGFLMPDTILVQQTYEGFRCLRMNETENLYFQKIVNWSKAGNPFAPVTQKFYTYYISAVYKDYDSGIPYLTFLKKPRIKLENYLHTTSFFSMSNIFEANYQIAGQAHQDSTKFSVCEDLSTLNQYSNIVGKMEYKGREGIEFYPQELFLLHYDADIPTPPDKVAARNFQNPKSKYKIPLETFILEKAYLRPLIKGTNIERFHLIKSDIVVPFPYKEGHREPIDICELTKVAPLLAAYFNRFKSVISAQTDYNAKIIGTKHNTEFYSLARVGVYSYAPHYVAFRDNTKWGACVISNVKTPWGEECRPQFQNHAVSISQTTSGRYITLDEAHYVCAILNAPIVAKYVIGSSDSRTFKIDIDIHIPEFDKDNPIHTRLSQLSKLAHENYNNNEIMSRLDCELDDLLFQLNNLTNINYSTDGIEIS